MLDQLGDVTEVVTWLVLALIHSFTLPISTPRDMELPLAVLHQLVILVEWAYKDFGCVCHLK